MREVPRPTPARAFGLAVAAGLGIFWSGTSAADAPTLEAVSQAAAPAVAAESAETPAQQTDSQSAVGAAQSSGNVAFPASPQSSPAMRYARLDRASCEAELGKRHVSYTRVADARGVLAPVRLTGALHGVTFHSALPASQRATSPYEILDCRLVLALDDFSAILAKYDVVEVVHMSVYRPPSPRFWPAGKLGKQHDGALAIDAGSFVKKDGTKLVVEKDFHGRIGAPTCGAGTGPSPASPEALTLRKLVCDAADAHLFNVQLTPDYNWQHRNHFHLEVTPNVQWFLVH